MRVNDWVAKLNEQVELANKEPFTYGKFNCGVFAARCADAIRTEGGAADELLTHFTDEASAREWVGICGGIENLVTERLGEPSEKWWVQTRGDVVLVDTQDGPAVGVSLGDSIAMLTPDAGVTYIKIDKATRVWRVE
jgi:hypothetical protein